MQIKTSVTATATKPASGMKVKTDVKGGYLPSPIGMCKLIPCGGPPITCQIC